MEKEADAYVRKNLGDIIDLAELAIDESYNSTRAECIEHLEDIMDLKAKVKRLESERKRLFVENERLKVKCGEMTDISVILDFFAGDDNEKETK